jgi:hypothetical protein
MPQTEIQTLVSEFAARLAAAVENSVAARVRVSVDQILGAAVKRGPGRPAKNGFAVAAAAPSVARTAKPRKKAPLQLCPVPGCKNAAAPIFGMVCARHKDLPKAKIRKYREARRAAKEKAAKKAA